MFILVRDVLQQVIALRTLVTFYHRHRGAAPGPRSFLLITKHWDQMHSLKPISKTTIHQTCVRNYSAQTVLSTRYRADALLTRLCETVTTFCNRCYQKFFARFSATNLRFTQGLSDHMPVAISKRTIALP